MIEGNDIVGDGDIEYVDDSNNTTQQKGSGTLKYNMIDQHPRINKSKRVKASERGEQAEERASV